MEAASNMWKSAPFILVLVQFCGAVTLNCTSTRTGDLMTYSIDNSQFPETKNSCYYSWDNSSTVLANHKNKLKEVKKNSLDALQTSGCFVELNWNAFCTSTTGHVVDFTANCMTSCAKIDLIFKEGSWFLAVLILLVAALTFLLFKFRKKICSGSTCSCSQCGGLYYTSVKMQNTDPKPEAVVVENK